VNECKYGKKSQNMDQLKRIEEKSLKKASPLTTSIEGRIVEEIYIVKLLYRLDNRNFEKEYLKKPKKNW